MKIRNGFVSNSSSSSFVVYLPKDYKINKEKLDKAITYYIDEENDEETINNKINQAISLLQSGGSITEYDNNIEFSILGENIEEDYILASFDTCSDAGEIIGITKNKLEKILQL